MSSYYMPYLDFLQPFLGAGFLGVDFFTGFAALAIFFFHLPPAASLFFFSPSLIFVNSPISAVAEAPNCAKSRSDPPKTNVPVCWVFIQGHNQIRRPILLTS